MRQKTILEASNLPLNLRALPPGVAYQLFAVGVFSRPAHTPRDPQISLSFRKVSIDDGIPLPDEPLIFKQVHVHAARSLRGGTMWTAEGAPLGASPLLQRRKISLGPGPLKPQSLVTILPAINDPTQLAELRHFLSPRLLHELATTPFVQVKHRATTFLIPCFELARAFYFWTGPKMVDFFFSAVQARQLCQAQRAPSDANRQRAKILLVVPPSLQDVLGLPKAYTELQITHLAHLFYSPLFARSFNLMHSSICRQWAKGFPAHSWLTLELGKQVSVHAEGVAFTYNGKSFFWTCGLPERASYFCFAHLDYVALYDTRSTAASGRPSAATESSASAGTYARMQVGPSLPHDSNQAGSSQYAGAQVHVPLDEIVHHPSAQRKSKELLKEHVTEWLRWWIKGRPTVMSERAGGCDLSVARVDLHLDVHRLTYAAYFEAIVAALRKHHVVNCLTQNTTDSSLSVPYCLLPRASRPATNIPYRVAVAEIVTGSGYMRGYFYFFQVLASRSLRSGFVYKSDQKQLTSNQLDDLLLAIHLKEDDWHKVKTELREGLARKFHVELVVLARNHIYIKSDVERCEKEIRSLAGLRKLNAP